MLQPGRSAIDALLDTNPGARVVTKDDPVLQESGATAKRVGTSELYLVVIDE